MRPDRDATGRHYQARVRRSKLIGDDENYDLPVGDDWCRKLPVEMRTTLMQLMNIELIVSDFYHCIPRFKSAFLLQKKMYLHSSDYNSFFFGYTVERFSS